VPMVGRVMARPKRSIYLREDQMRSETLLEVQEPS
jgi:hypothetical protein